MRDIVEHINKTFENRIRLAIMSALVVNDHMEFNQLKQLLDVTDGNLASHIAALEKQKYIAVTKRFVGKKPQTTYTATPAGKRAFTEHIDALEQLIRRSQ